VATIKKIVIPKSDLPGFLGAEEQYIVRYRIVSEDKNRVSAWSPQHKVSKAAVPANILNSISVNLDSRVISLVWQPQPGVTEYHVYVKWDSGEWLYLDKTTQPNYQIVYSSDKSAAEIAVQVPTIPLQRFTSATLFSGTATLV
jgi:hypothetical protein